MSGLSTNSGGFVSNPSDRTIRNSARNARNRAHVAESVCSSERGESQLKKLNMSSGPSEGQLNNRKLLEPPRGALALRQAKNNWTQIEGLRRISVCLASLRIHKLAAYLTGIVFGDRGKHGISSCRGGGKVACPLFEARDFEEASLLYYPSRCRHMDYDECPSIGDNGNRRKLAVTIARGTSAPDHSLVHALCVVQGLLARCGLDSVKWIAYLFRWHFSLCIQGKGTDLLGEKSGRADVSRSDGLPPPHFSGTVSHSWQFNLITTDYVSPRPKPQGLPYSRMRHSFPACSPHESSHPFAQFSSCLPTFVQDQTVSGLPHASNVSQGEFPSAPRPEQHGMWNSYLSTAYLYLPTSRGRFGNYYLVRSKRF